MRPVIGITSRLRDLTGSIGVSTAHTVNVSYADAVVRSGGTPVALVPAPEPGALAGRLDGLLLSGGGDVNPSCYGGDPHPSLYDVDDARDRFEIDLVHEARRRRLPTLAICRGMQVLNVALGGTLVVDIPSWRAGALAHSRVGQHAYERHQPLAIDSSSRLAATIGTSLAVNSIHHQAIDRIAPQLRAVGTAEDGIVEAVDHEDPSWPVWAVQWHPELLADGGPDRSLFDALVRAAAGYASQGPD